MNFIIKYWQNNAQKNSKQNQKFLKNLKPKDQKKTDRLAQELHEEAFDKMSCLDCANCCKTISPIITTTDIERIAKHLRIKSTDVIARYLLLDEDNDFVMNTAPCPFLGADNYCSIYEARPKACKEYPHTDAKNFVQKKNLHYKNTLVCPAALYVVEEMQKKL